MLMIMDKVFSLPPNGFCGLKKKDIYQKLKGLSMWGEGHQRKTIIQMTGRRESLRIYSDLH